MIYLLVSKEHSRLDIRECSWYNEKGVGGELAKQVMIKEKYYALTGEVADVDERLGNEMADVIAQVMRLAMHYNIDLEKAFVEAREDEDNYLKSRGV